MTEKVYYNIDSILKKRVKNLRREFFKIKKVNIFIYKINYSLNKKFLEYLLYKDDNNNSLYFPRFSYDVEELTKKSKSKSFIDITEEKIKHIFKNIENLFVLYNGYLIYEDELYVFYEIKGNFSFIIDTITKTSYIFTTIHEIINERKFLNYSIYNKVTELFINNPILIYLKDKETNNIEIPTVLYHGTEKSKVDFISIFGVEKQNAFDIFGPYYYFFSYEDSLRYGGWTNDLKPLVINNKTYTSNKNGKYITGAIIRFAIFLGNIKVKTDINEGKNKLLIPKELQAKYLETSNLNLINKNSINEIYKLSDIDGEWTKKYNSIYASKNKLLNHDVFTINDIDNAVCLTVQYIDNSKLPSNYDKKIDTNQNLLL